MLITLVYLGQHENTVVFTLAEVLDQMLDEVHEYKKILQIDMTKVKMLVQVMHMA